MHHNSVVRCLQLLPIVKAKMCVPSLTRRKGKSPAHNLRHNLDTAVYEGRLTSNTCALAQRLSPVALGLGPGEGGCTGAMVV